MALFKKIKSRISIHSAVLLVGIYIDLLSWCWRAITYMFITALFTITKK